MWARRHGAEPEETLRPQRIEGLLGRFSEVLGALVRYLLAQWFSKWVVIPLGVTIRYPACQILQFITSKITFYEEAMKLLLWLGATIA